MKWCVPSAGSAPRKSPLPRAASCARTVRLQLQPADERAMLNFSPPLWEVIFRAASGCVGIHSIKLRPSKRVSDFLRKRGDLAIDMLTAVTDRLALSGIVRTALNIEEMMAETVR